MERVIMKKTKIEWCDTTWNPVTGCMHGCEYCYARRIAERFGGCDKLSTYGIMAKARFHRVNPESDIKDAIFETSEKMPPVNVRFDSKRQLRKISIAPYPFGFQPTLHRHLLNQPSKWKKPKRIFVCSMADLFGGWVPDEWIEAVFDVCRQNPQHEYLFLTKNPGRYYLMGSKGKLPTKTDMTHLWFGTTITNNDEGYFFSAVHNTFLSIEPILAAFSYTENPIRVDWVILGAETGNRKDKYVPTKACVLNILKSCDVSNVPVFMKESLAPIVGEEHMRRQFPDFRK